MTSIKELAETYGKAASGKSDEDVMQNPDYLKDADDIIKKALKEGMDVLQLENGDIVTTGTKIVVTQFHWDSKKKKMVKLSERTGHRSCK